MAKGPFINDGIKRFIAEVYRNHPDWRAKEVLAEVYRLSNGRAPGLSAIQKILKEMRDRQAQAPFDKKLHTWHLGTLDEFPMSAEAIRRIFEVQRLIRSPEQREVLPKGIMPLTIRQALWIARLHAVVKKASNLWLISWAYSLYEETCELAETECDTYEFDTILLDGDLVRLLRALDHWIGTDERFKASMEHYIHHATVGDNEEVQ